MREAKKKEKLVCSTENEGDKLEWMQAIQAACMDISQSSSCSVEKSSADCQVAVAPAPVPTTPNTLLDPHPARPLPLSPSPSPSLPPSLPTATSQAQEQKCPARVKLESGTPLESRHKAVLNPAVAKQLELKRQAAQQTGSMVLLEKKR